MFMKPMHNIKSFLIRLLQVDEKMRRGMSDREAFRAGASDGQRNRHFVCKDSALQGITSRRKCSERRERSIGPNIDVRARTKNAHEVIRFQHPDVHATPKRAKAAVRDAYEADPELRLVLGFRVSIREAPALSGLRRAHGAAE